MGIAGRTPLKEAKEPRVHGFRGERGIFNGASEKFVSVRGFPFAKTSGDSPYLGPIVFIPFDELCGEGKTLANGDLEGGDVIIVADEVGRDAGLIEIEVLVLASLHGRLQAVFGVIDASTHSCAISLPGEFAELDSGDESGDNFSEAFGGDFVVGRQGGEDGVRGHGSVLVENDGRGMAVIDKLDGIGARGRNGVVDTVIGHCCTKVLDEVAEVMGEPGIWSEDKGCGGLEEAFQVEIVLPLIFWRVLSSKGRHLWYFLIKSSACTFSDGSHILSLCGYPFHLIRYCTWRRRPNMR